MSFADKMLTCRDCGMQFTFTSGEQDFYAQKGFEHEPTRCPRCRQARKQTRNDGSYNRDSYSGSRYGSSSGIRSGLGGAYGAEREQREMHTTTCSACGHPARVPFVPRGDKPTYCSDCFQSQRSTHRSARW